MNARTEPFTALVPFAERRQTRSSRPPVSDETRARMRAAKLGRSHSPEHRAAVSAALRQWYSSPDAHLKGRSALMTAEEVSDYRTIRAARYSRDQALAMIGRPDLIDWHPTPKVPRSVWRRLTVAERVAYFGTWREATSWRHELELFGRGDLTR